MSAPHRCRRCQHRPGPRRVTATCKKRSGHTLGEPKFHKKSCTCSCHYEED